MDLVLSFLFIFTASLYIMIFSFTHFQFSLFLFSSFSYSPSSSFSCSTSPSFSSPYSSLSSSLSPLYLLLLLLTRQTDAQKPSSNSALSASPLSLVSTFAKEPTYATCLKKTVEWSTRTNSSPTSPTTILNASIQIL